MCGCQRTTYLCSCRHKERIIERCHIYQLRQDGSCFAWCFPRCRTKVRKHRLQRVCLKCEEYFREKYGEEHHERFVEAFLEYKEKKGWSKTAIDPRTVPREVLLQRQSAPAGLGAQMGKQLRATGQPYPVHENMTLPSTVPAIRNQRRPRTPVANHDNRHPGPAAGVAGQRRDQRFLNMSPNPARTKRSGTPFPHKQTPSPNGSDVRVPQVSGDRILLPTDPNLFAVGDAEEDYDGDSDDAAKDRVFTPSPVPKYNSTNLPSAIGIIPELAHLTKGRRSRRRHGRSFPVLEHPTPKTHKLRKALRRDSDCSLVKKLTKAARRIEIPNIDYIEFEGLLVPRIMTPPKGSPRTRTPITSDSSRAASPEPESDDDTGSIDIAIAASEVPEFLIPGRGAAEIVDGQNGRLTRSTSTYFIIAQPDAHSPTGASAHVRHSPSHQSVVMPPPQRLDGVLVPSAATCPHHANKGKGSSTTDDDCPTCRSTFFKERGLPSKSYLQRECRSATLPVKDRSGVNTPMYGRAKSEKTLLVSVHVPERSYSCAVQASCYCRGDGEDGKCPSCLEREAISRELHTTWI
ncbi:hypothetical protein F5Y03DRAFT_405598 [Xylaria venustula]|nr:hypothetical protein F5Y03DRAFT_405598 [Xylaria venustula]